MIQASLAKLIINEINIFLDIFAMNIILKEHSNYFYKYLFQVKTSINEVILKSLQGKTNSITHVYKTIIFDTFCYIKIRFRILIIKIKTNTTHLLSLI